MSIKIYNRNSIIHEQNVAHLLDNSFLKIKKIFLIEIPFISTESSSSNASILYLFWIAGLSCRHSLRQSSRCFRLLYTGPCIRCVCACLKHWISQASLYRFEDPFFAVSIVGVCLSCQAPCQVFCLFLRCWWCRRSRSESPWELWRSHSCRSSCLSCWSA